MLAPKGAAAAEEISTMPWPAMPARVRARLDRLILSGLLSDCEIGRRVALSHTTVWKRRQLLFGENGEKTMQKLAGHERYVPTDGPNKGKLRCPDCGGLIVILPCRLCVCLRRLEGDRAAREAGLIGSGLPPEKSLRLKQRQLFEASGVRRQASGEEGPDLVEGAKVPAIAGPGSGLLKHFGGTEARARRGKLRPSARV